MITQATKKQEIRDWLKCNQISAAVDMRKAELLELVNRLFNMMFNKTYYVNKLLKIHGHIVVRLPPHLWKLNIR